MKHEPQPPIRPRQRGTPGSLPAASVGLPATSIGRQPKRVVIRVPFVETEATLSTRHTTPEQPAGSVSATVSHEKTTVVAPAAIKSQPEATVERTIRIEAAHDAMPAPHTDVAAVKQSSGWLTSVLQKKTLLAFGLIISILILVIVIHQRSGHESAAESTNPHQRLAKSERHASVVRKSPVDGVTATGQPSNSQPRQVQASTTTAQPIIRQSLGTDFTNGPALLKSDAIPMNATANSTTGAAANVPATIGSGTNAANSEPFLPQMPDRSPPHEALAPPVNAGTAEAQYFGFAPGEGTSPIAVAARGGASFEGPISNSPIPAPTVKK